MTHALLAAVFCTSALIVLAVEQWTLRDRQVIGFSILYGIGMLGWAVLGVQSDSALLVTISVVQFSSALVIFLSVGSKGIKEVKDEVCKS